MQTEGTVVGERYRLLHRIGEGGIAAVWEAEHVTLGSRVAVKFLHTVHGESAQRFLREARVAASVKHRNVVEIIDFGFDDDRPYMVMELLRGVSLADHLAAHGPLPVVEAVAIVAGVLRGLSAVHDAGLVHRDLKPDNVFLVDDEDGAFPKLIDFGLSRRAGRGDMTLEGALLGTPDYMSPEQARGKVEIDARTDVYAVGVMLYELLSAHMPFEAPTVTELLIRVDKEEPTSIRAWVPDIDPALALVITTAMQKERDARYPSARSMRQALAEAMGSAFPDRGSGLVHVPSREIALPLDFGSGSGPLRKPRPRSEEPQLVVVANGDKTDEERARGDESRRITQQRATPDRGAAKEPSARIVVAEPERASDRPTLDAPDRDSLTATERARLTGKHTAPTDAGVAREKPRGGGGAWLVLFVTLIAAAGAAAWLWASGAIGGSATPPTGAEPPRGLEQDAGGAAGAPESATPVELDAGLRSRVVSQPRDPAIDAGADAGSVERATERRTKQRTKRPRRRRR